MNGDARAVLRSLRSSGHADENGFAVGSTLTLPIRTGTAADAIAAVGELGMETGSVSTRPPTLDDVYLRLTGGRLADAA